MEEGGKECECLCKGRYVHEECLMKAAEARGDDTCSVCKGKIGNLTVERKEGRKGEASPFHLLLSLICLSALALSVILAFSVGGWVFILMGVLSSISSTFFVGLFITDHANPTTQTQTLTITVVEVV